MHLPLQPPLQPTPAKATSAPPPTRRRARASTGLPDGAGWLYEPKWDGFRAIVFRDGDEVLIQSRDLKPLDRYFPELAAPIRAPLPARAVVASFPEPAPPIRAAFPARCVVDGEVVIARDGELDFEALLLRIHPAESRVRMLAADPPASFVAWDLLALDDEALRAVMQGERRTRLEAAFATVEPPIHLTPATRDRSTAADWFDRFEGAGL